MAAVIPTAAGVEASLAALLLSGRFSHAAFVSLQTLPHDPCPEPCEPRDSGWASGWFSTCSFCCFWSALLRGPCCCPGLLLGVCSRMSTPSGLRPRRQGCWPAAQQWRALQATRTGSLGALSPAPCGGCCCVGTRLHWRPQPEDMRHSLLAWSLPWCCFPQERGSVGHRFSASHGA